jgi:UDP-3-O-[3-hydroxymyristoyl] N-acetylglucosamine deacetylase/3-hydroxyacyl-[acyl-carrier-protein] dehydratase
MPRNQRTVRREASIAGVGLHSGAAASLAVRPAPAGTGVVFLRTDLPGSPRVPAEVGRQVQRQRRTTLVGEDGAEVHTVEHFLACCHALRIDNLLVEVSGPECPGMDGSAAPFVRMLDEAGVEEQAAPRAEIEIDEPVAVAAGTDAALVAIPAPSGLAISYTLDYRHPHLGAQHFSVALTEERFRAEVAPARTFCLEAEAEALRSMGLGKGATRENTLVVGKDGVTGNALRFPDEFARHKALDLVGDLFLLGADLRAHVHAYRTGHEANLGLVRALRDRAARRGTPAASSERAPDALPRTALSLAQIRRVLPHRYPFLLVDRVVEIDGFRRAVGLKNVTANEPYFQGHYPDEPIMPGVLVVEAMAQLAGILLLRKLELTGKVPVLLSIDRVKFRHAVVPGDQLRLEAATIRLSGGRGRVQCRSSVEGRLVAEARLNFAVAEVAG